MPTWIGYNQVAETAVFFVDREPFAPKPGFGTVLRAGIDFQLYQSAHGLYRNFASQYGRVQINVHIGVQVISFTFEVLILIDNEGDV